MHLFNTLLIILAPLLPDNIPANVIYMGQGVAPIHSIKIKKGFVSDNTYMLLTPYNFVRVKSALENSPDLCTLAIDETVKTCTQGLEREKQIMQQREQNDAQILLAYESRLSALESELQIANKHNKIMVWVTSAVGLVATVSTTIAILR
tara:strand:+ start:104 stop:550 length:447 start_codon:yes stop_codon:yes gene_type:complete